MKKGEGIKKVTKADETVARGGKIGITVERMGRDKHWRIYPHTYEYQLRIITHISLSRKHNMYGYLFHKNTIACMIINKINDPL